MIRFSPSLDPAQAAASLASLLTPHLDKTRFETDLNRLQRYGAAFAAACPSPWPAPGLVLTPEIHYQSELWLPLDVIRPAFERFYRAALRYAPVLTSTPFADAVSWAEIAAMAPKGCSTNPAELLEGLLSDSELRIRFLFWSFMPKRFYGSCADSYPRQTAWLAETMAAPRHDQVELHCLDAACGDGTGTYRLLRLAQAQGWRTERLAMEGWSLDPLECWAAAHASFPHDRERERQMRRDVAGLFSSGATAALTFRPADLLDPAVTERHFDLIVCNGLLGGPIIRRQEQMATIVRNLSALLKQGGVLLAADRFHGGWKKNIPGKILGDAFRNNGLKVVEAGEGIAGLLEG